jgi:hypothetical protein
MRLKTEARVTAAIAEDQAVRLRQAAWGSLINLPPKKHLRLAFAALMLVACVYAAVKHQPGVSTGALFLGWSASISSMATVAQALFGFYPVKGYGAVGDAATDDLAAFDRAVAAVPTAYGGCVLVGNGNFVVLDRVVCDKSNVTIRGTSFGSKITLQAGSGKHNVIRFNSTTDTNPATAPVVSNVELCFLQIECQGGDVTWAAGGVPGAAVAYNCRGPRFHHLLITNALDYGINIKSCVDAVVDESTVDGTYCQSACNPINVNASATIPSSEMSVTNCRVFNRITATLTAATRVDTTATFTTSAAHKLKTGQYIKVTGVTPADYNGFWLVSTVPTTTTFTCTLLTTPAGVGTVFGTVRLMADRGVYVGGYNSVRTVATGNRTDHCTAGVTAETGTPTASTEIVVNTNTVSNFSTFGAGITTSGAQGLWASRGQVNDNIIRGLDGTTEFGMPGTGSLTGVEAQGSNITMNDNQVSNVREGGYIGLGTWAVDEVNHQIIGGQYLLATDATGSGLKVEHTDGTTAVRRVKIRDVQIDGQLGTASGNGVLLKGRVIGFDIGGVTSRGMGRSGIKLEASGAQVPSAGKIADCTCVDNANASSTAINKVGIAIDEAVDNVDLSDNKCYDTRGGSALQTYGLHVAATATNITSADDRLTGNLTGEINDLSNGIGFRRTVATWPPMTADPRAAVGLSAIGANRVIYARVIKGSGLCSSIKIEVGAVDGTTPGTTNQGYVAVYDNKTVAGLPFPNARKTVSASVTLTANAVNTIALGTSIWINEGDWIAIGIASNTTTVQCTFPSAVGAFNTGFAGFESLTPPLPPTTPAATAGTGTTVKIPIAIGVA